MKKRIKSAKMTAIFALLLLLTAVAGALPASAAQSFDLYLESYSSGDGKLLIYLNHTADLSEESALADRFEITLGSQTLPTEEVTTVSESGEAVTYLFLVDVSGTISDEHMTQTREFLKQIAASKGEADRVCVATFGNNLYAGDFLTDMEEINAAIDAIAGTHEDTSLYACVVDALKLLSGDTGSTKKALVIISDGHEDQTTGITSDEVKTQLEKSRIPVYTAAMLDASATDEEQEYAKVLGSFARQSAGGFHFTFGVDDVSIEEGARQITDSISESLIVTADLSDYQIGTGKATLTVRMELSDGSAAKDDLDITESALSLSSINTEETEPEITETERAFFQQGIRIGSMSFALWQLGIVVAILVLLLIVILAVVLRRRRKPESDEKFERMDAYDTDDTAGDLPGDDTGSPTENISATSQISESVPGMTEALENAMKRELEKDGKEKEPDVHKDAASDGISLATGPISDRVPEKNGKDSRDSDCRTGVILYLTRIGATEEKTYTIQIDREVTLGRDPGKCTYAFPEDNLISGVHCGLKYSDHHMILWDAGSRNGTRVNGIKITAPYMLNVDDVVRIGRTQFRVHWKSDTLV